MSIVPHREDDFNPNLHAPNHECSIACFKTCILSSTSVAPTKLIFRMTENLRLVKFTSLAIALCLRQAISRGGQQL